MQEIHLLSGGAGQGLVDAIAPAFSAATGMRIAGTFGAVGAMKELLVGGTKCDVLLLTDHLVRTLASEGWVMSESVVPVGRIRTGIAVCDGSPYPKVGSPEELRAALLRAEEIYLPDPERATAGIHFMKVVDALGIESVLRSRLRPHPNGATAMRAMSDGGNRHAIGCTQITEILIAPGVRYVAALPKEFELATVYSAGACASTAHPEAARELVSLMTGPNTARLRREAGIE